MQPDNAETRGAAEGIPPLPWPDRRSDDERLADLVAAAADRPKSIDPMAWVSGLVSSMVEGYARLFCDAEDDRDVALTILWASITAAERSMVWEMLLQPSDQRAGLEELRRRVVADWRTRMRRELRDELFHLLFGEIETGSAGESSEQRGDGRCVGLLKLSSGELRRFDDLFFARHAPIMAESPDGVENREATR